jgi:hypothetical protein
MISPAIAKSAGSKTANRTRILPERAHEIVDDEAQSARRSHRDLVECFELFIASLHAPTDGCPWA